MKVRFLTPANLELDEAVQYYDQELPGLGFRFFQSVMLTENGLADRVVKLL